MTTETKLPFWKPGMSEKTYRLLATHWQEDKFRYRVNRYNRKHFTPYFTNFTRSVGKPVRALLRDTKANRAYYNHPGNPIFTFDPSPRGVTAAVQLQKMGVHGDRIHWKMGGTVIAGGPLS